MMISNHNDIESQSNQSNQSNKLELNKCCNNCKLYTCLILGFIGILYIIALISLSIYGFY